MNDAYATIKLAANHGKLILVKNHQLTAGNIGSVFMAFQLRSDDWQSCEKITAIFNDYYTRELDDNLKCDIPPEVLATPCTFEVGLCGKKENIRLSTNKIEFIVGEGSCGGFFPDNSSGNNGKTYVYVPTISDDKILTLTLEEEPGVESISVDLNPFDEWASLPEEGVDSEYVWVDM